MSGELLEYLAEYCAGGGHASIRYIEKVALGWYQAGIRTREEAREHTARFSGDTAAVLKAFGITGRTAGTAEQEFIRRWFKEYGFDKSSGGGSLQPDDNGHWFRQLSLYG